MLVDFQKCISRPLEIRQAIELTENCKANPEIEGLEPVFLEAQVSSVGSGQFLFSGSFTSRFSSICVRCLDSVPMNLTGKIQLTCLPEAMRPTDADGEHEMPTGEVKLCYYKNDKMDIVPILEEHFHLALPMRFLCSEECRGICQYCGANKNLTDCGCVEPARLDPRLEIIKGLRH